MALFLVIAHVRLMTKMAAAHSVNMIGHSFVKQYYLQMHQNPSQLHRFYQEDSSLAHGGNELGTSEAVKGQKVRVGVGVPSVYDVCASVCLCSMCGWVSVGASVVWTVSVWVGECIHLVGCVWVWVWVWVCMCICL